MQPDRLVAEAAAEVRADPILGWAPYVSTEVDDHTVEGDHLTMMRAPQVASLAKAIDRALTTHSAEEES